MNSRITRRALTTMVAATALSLSFGLAWAAEYAAPQPLKGVRRVDVQQNHRIRLGCLGRASHQVLREPHDRVQRPLVHNVHRRAAPADCDLSGCEPCDLPALRVRLLRCRGGVHTAWCAKGLSMASSRLFVRMLTVMAVLALVSVSALSEQSANASIVECGDVITQRHVTLDRDLDCQEGDGLIIGRNNVTIDLNGHRISGRGVAIRNQGFNKVTVLNGTLGPLDGTSIVVHDAANMAFRDLQIAGCCPAGFHVIDSRRVSIEDSVLNDVEISLIRSRNNVLRRNHISNSNTDGLGLIDADSNRIEENTIGPNELNGAWVSGSRNKIRGNTFTGHHYRGGLRVVAGKGNTVEGNDASLGNLVGILVHAEAANTLISGNTARANRTDGIHVLSPSTTISNNTANDNGGWGIFAVPGVRDRGGNTAEGNGLGQCENVSCD
jgi:parallel beta-helix repeat protein